MWKVQEKKSPEVSRLGGTSGCVYLAHKCRLVTRVNFSTEPMKRVTR